MRNLLFIIALATGLAALPGCITYFAKPQPNNGVARLTEIPAEFLGILKDSSGMNLDMKVARDHIRLFSDTTGKHVMVGKDIILGMHNGYLIVNIIKPISQKDTVYTAFAFRVDSADKDRIYWFICTPDTADHVQVASHRKVQDSLIFVSEGDPKKKDPKKKMLTLFILDPTKSEFDNLFAVMEARNQFAVLRRQH